MRARLRPFSPRTLEQRLTRTMVHPSHTRSQQKGAAGPVTFLFEGTVPQNAHPVTFLFDFIRVP